MHIHFLHKPQMPLQQQSQGQGFVLTIGNFDGVHFGHESLLEYVGSIAAKYNLHSAILSFYPHPKSVINKQYIFYSIYNLRQKIITLFNYVDNIFLAKFDNKLANLSVQEFVENLNNLKVKHIVVGSDFKFGKNRHADINTMQELCIKYGIQVHNFSVLNNKDTKKSLKYSSSEVRDFLRNANFIDAKRVIGRSFIYSARVVKGRQLGRKLGFPTLNLKVCKNFILPTGIYCVYVYGLESKKLPAVASLGFRPTIENNAESKFLLEVHILNWSGNAYGKIVSIEFIQKLRQEEKFNSLQELIIAMQNDVIQAIKILRDDPEII